MIRSVPRGSYDFIIGNRVAAYVATCTEFLGRGTFPNIHKETAPRPYVLTDRILVMCRRTYP